MALKLDTMNKAAEGLKLSLAKKGIHTAPQADLAFDLDVSGSFDDEHRDGLTQALLERLVPWGMVFDPDKKMDVFTFSNGDDRAYYVGEITPESTEGYISKKIIGRVPGYNGGTDYSYVLEKNLQHFGWLQSAGSISPAPKKGLMGMFSKKTEAAAAATLEKKRSIVLFVTDGDNSDKERTERILAESEGRGDEVYFLFIGISNQGGGFPFLQKIGDRFNNTGLVVIRDLKSFVQKTDEEINEQLIGDELVEWLKK